ncbi:protein big brother [Trichonephila clavipes]|nr:protein big brother [Trichonephila clavipes]
MQLPEPKMLPFDSVSRFLMNMPRVVIDQKAKFESDDLFKKLSRESEVRYTGHKDRPMDERRMKFKAACREGYTDIAFVSSGINFKLFFGPYDDGCQDRCEFEQDKGKRMNKIQKNQLKEMEKGNIETRSKLTMCLRKFLYYRTVRFSKFKNVLTDPIMTSKVILEFAQSSKNIMKADSDDENEMNNIAPVSTSSEMSNIMKSMHSYLDAHSNDEMNNKWMTSNYFVQFDAKKAMRK